MALSSPGIGSNLDVNSIIQQLMTAEAQPLAALATKEASYQAKISAYGTLSGALGAFQTALSGLNSTSKFQALSATTGDTTIATATASTEASPGSFDIDITKMAQSQTLATAGVASTTTAIGTGATTTITFQFGTIGGGTEPADGIYPAGTTFSQSADKATGSITIDSSNNSLQGIRDAINKAGIGVRASIISDGSATPNRLVLTSTATGANSSMKITVSGDAALQDLLTYDASDENGQKLTQSAAAQDTELTVNGIAVRSATRTVSEAIQGVTIVASKVGSTSLSVTRDTASATSAINAFVKAYNDVNKTLKDLTAYDPSTKVGGPLIGDAAVRTIQNGLRQMFNQPIPELAGNSIRTLSDVGIAFQKDGSLAVDSSKLQKAISTKFDEVAALFAPFGSSTDSLISMTGSSGKTEPGTYEVEITRLATKGSVTGTVDLTAAPVVIDPETTFNVTIDGVSGTVDLVPGTYDAAGLAVMLQSAINGTSVFSGADVSVKAAIDENGHLNITSNRYGSASNVTLAKGNGTGTDVILGSSPESKIGVDVAGKIGGVEGSGSGQTLSAASGSLAYGMKLLVTGGATGDRGVINFSRGFADRMYDVVGGFLGSSGLISGRTDGLKASIKDIDRSRENLTARLETIEQRYRAQFNALDLTISQMTQTSTYLQQQLANLAKIGSE